MSVPKFSFCKLAVIREQSMQGSASRKTIPWLVILILFTLFFSFSTEGVISAQPVETLTVTFIDVGQGDSSLLSTSNGTDILIDAGPKSAGAAVLALLNAKGITELDVIVISHNHADHLGGLVAVLQSPITVGQVLYNGNLCTTQICQGVWAAMANRGLTPQAVDAGDSFSWGSVTSAMLNPQSPGTGDEDENEDSIVMHVAFYEVDLLYTGDIGFTTETLLLGRGVLVPVEVLKVAHHGSAGSTSTAFLSAVTPGVSVISVGAENAYDHPSEETLDRLAASGTDVHRTDLAGTISFRFNPDGAQIVPILIYLPLMTTGGDQ
jgi:beta-lactamase superfamily II metal-dependent hydrolase